MAFWALAAGVAGARAEGQENIETLIAALQIKGQKPYEKITLRDLDILITDDSLRSIPLRRLLTATGMWSKEVEILCFSATRTDGNAG